jgi:hypothetical protein
MEQERVRGRDYAARFQSLLIVVIVVVLIECNVTRII